MKPLDADYLNVGTRLTVTFVLLMVLILGGNGLVIWQFNLARTQTDRLAGANQQMIVVLQLQVNLLSFHQRLDDLARSRDFQRLVGEVKPLRRALHEQTQRTRSALASRKSSADAPADARPMILNAASSVERGRFERSHVAARCTARFRSEASSSGMYA